MELNEFNQNTNSVTFSKLKSENENNENLNFFSIYFEKLGFTRNETLKTFMFCSLVEVIWGCESCFISIYITEFAASEFINPFYMTLSVSILYSMMGIGSLNMSFLGEKYGRIKASLGALFIYIICVVGCSIFDDFKTIIILRSIANLCVGIDNLLLLNLLTEYLPTRNRCFYLMIYSSFYNIGNLYCILIKVLGFNFKISNLLVSIPAIISVILILLNGKESPLYLFSKSRDKEALDIVKSMAVYKNAEYNVEIETSILKDVNSRGMNQIQSKYSELFKRSFLSLTLLCLIINLISYTNMIAISYLVPKTVKYMNNLFSEESQLLIYGLIQLPNGFIGGWMSESYLLGRIKTISLTCILCGVCYLMVFAFPFYISIFGGLIFFFNSISFGVIYIYISEVYPTQLRDHSQSFIQLITFIVGSFSPFYVDYVHKNNHLYHYIFFGATCFLCGLITLFLPIETRGRELDRN